MATLADNALTTLDTVAEELPGYTAGGSDDSRIARYVNRASDLFERYTGRKWYYLTGHVERVRAFGEPELFVTDHVPIDSVTSIVYDDGDTTDTVDSDDYAVHEADRGVIRRINSTWAATNYRRRGIVQHPQPGTEQVDFKVTYDGGYVTQEQADNDGSLTRDLPWDIESAVIDFVVMLDAQQGADRSVSRISMDDGSIEYGRIMGQRVPGSFVAAANAYANVIP